MRFEWGNNKDKINTKKHGLTFEEATTAFYDKNDVYLFDRKIGNEIRQHIIGKVNNVIIALVVFTERGGNIRVISARKANKKEKEQYHGKQA
jgi:uncharacterized protein